jgi:hypothetical protein
MLVVPATQAQESPADSTAAELLGVVAVMKDRAAVQQTFVPQLRLVTAWLLRQVVADLAVSAVAQVVLPEEAPATQVLAGKAKVVQVHRREPAETVAHQMAEPGVLAEALALAARVDQAQHPVAVEVAVVITVAVAAEPTSMVAAPTVVVAVVDHPGITLH